MMVGFVIIVVVLVVFVAIVMIAAVVIVVAAVVASKVGKRKTQSFPLSDKMEERNKDKGA